MLSKQTLLYLAMTCFSLAVFAIGRPVLASGPYNTGGGCVLTFDEVHQAHGCDDKCSTAGCSIETKVDPVTRETVYSCSKCPDILV